MGNPVPYPVLYTENDNEWSIGDFNPDGGITVNCKNDYSEIRFGIGDICVIYKKDSPDKIAFNRKGSKEFLKIDLDDEEIKNEFKFFESYAQIEMLAEFWNSGKHDVQDIIQYIIQYIMEHIKNFGESDFRISINKRMEKIQKGMNCIIENAKDIQIETIVGSVPKCAWREVRKYS